MIPRRLIRTVPQRTTAEQEAYWEKACALHPAWEHVTLRDPVDPTDFPSTSAYWVGCETGAQLADLIRVEEVYRRGGVYIDSDVEVLRPFDSLLGASMFAAWQDHSWVCNAVFGAEPGHTALGTILKLSIARQGAGTLAAGIETFHEVVHNRDDILLLPPGAFYPYHWTVRDLYAAEHPGGQGLREAISEDNPWAFCMHHWHGSWKG